MSPSSESRCIIWVNSLAYFSEFTLIVHFSLLCSYLWFVLFASKRRDRSLCFSPLYTNCWRIVTLKCTPIHYCKYCACIGNSVSITSSILLTINVLLLLNVPAHSSIKHLKKGKTRKLCYRKDDRAMRPIHGALKTFGTPWLRPRLLFPTFFMGFCSDPPYECSFKIWNP